MPDRPLCFVLMPFGTKPDPAGRPPIDFNRVYHEAIEPAIEQAGLQPIRADEEKTGGIIHKPMFERLLLCEYAVADLTTANANVFYELGVRHTARPRTTQSIFAVHQPIPFDVNFLRALPYELGENNVFGPELAAKLRDALAARLQDLRGEATQGAEPDSPIFQLLGEWRPGDLARLKTDLFRERVAIGEERRERMARARRMSSAEGVAELRALQGEIALDAEEAGVLVDLLISYRALKAWDEMVALFEVLPRELRRQILVREQVAFALNRRAGTAQDPAEKAADRDRALEMLEAVEAEQGPSAETCGLIGRIYKDFWDDARAAEPARAKGFLKKAIDAYVRGFEADPRDAYPGINAVTLLEVHGKSSSRRKRDELVPVVRFAVGQRLRGKSPDYWDHATLLELAVLGGDEEAAEEALENSLAAVREVWEPETTARNLRLIREARAGRDEETDWIDEIVEALEEAAEGA